MNVLLIAYECSPYRGSEWAVGWGRVLQAARVAHVHVLVSEANFHDLQRARAKGLIPSNVHVHTPPPDVRLRRLEQRPVHFDYNYRAYRHWHTLALALAQRLHAQVGFHVAHQTTVCTFREPGQLHRLGIPFVWGPFGGTQNFPLRMLPLLGPKAAAKEAARSLVNRLTLRLSPAVRRAAQHAAVVFAANSTTLRDMTRITGPSKVRRLLETGLTTVDEPDRTRFHVRAADAAQGREPRPLRLLWSGQLRPRKALPVLLRALASLGAAVRFELDILGDGPMLAAWQREAHRIAPANPVRFHGRLAFTNAVASMHRADLFCFTSLRDTSGNVVLEALAAGVPVLCFDYQGAHDMVDDRSGIRIPVTTPRDAVHRWAAAIRTLSADPDRLLALSHGATTQARQFLWSNNGDTINTVYANLASASAHAQPQRTLPAAGPTGAAAHA